MKLLSLKIENKDGFRSLQQGFEIKFHAQDDRGTMEAFRPFCLAGLNGSGKSNVLEALANIFYHLELCVARYLPDSIKNPDNFKRTECTPDAFTLEYLIGPTTQEQQSIADFNKVVITKKVGTEPAFKIYTYPFTDDKLIIPNPNTIKEDIEKGVVSDLGKLFEAHDKVCLPDNVIGYSSGENEILSLPFIKSRLIRLDEYKQSTEAKAESYDTELEEKRARNSLIYIDNNMSQAVLLTCLLFENKKTLAPLKDVDNTGILGLRSFRINIHLHDFTFVDEKGEQYYVPILKLIDQHQLSNLMKCATSWFLDEKEKVLWLDFYVNGATKDAFREHFKTSFECFQFFRLLYELNSHFVDEKTKEEVYRSKGVYTDGKLPVGSPKQDVFHFLDFYITKELKKTGEVKDLLLRSFSDGEHQFIHTMGICLLLKGRRTLLLLDEPETHFNPTWRAKFVKILNDSIEASSKEEDSEKENDNDAQLALNDQSLEDDNNKNEKPIIHLLKDVLLTSHSPFIISDCLPDNVILFDRDEEGKVFAKKASELGIDTYGTSVNLLTNRIFKSRETIGKYVLSKLNSYRKRLESEADKDEIIEEINNEFGDSIEKLLLIKEIKDN
jgi:restriction system-associated AAA family ATPase